MIGRRRGDRKRGRKRTGTFALRVFICFLNAGISGEDLNRTFISFPDVSFQDHGL